MSAQLTCDLTGNNPLFRISNLRYRITKQISDVLIKFPQAAYSTDSSNHSVVTVKKVGADGIVTTLTEGAGADYYLPESCRDWTAEATVRAANPTSNFSKKLFTGFYIRKTVFAPDEEFIDISVDFQSVFPNILSSSVDVAENPGGPMCTPELLREIVQDLCYIKGTINGTSTGSIVLLSDANINLYTDRTLPVCETVDGTYVSRVITLDYVGQYVYDRSEASGSLSYARALSLPSPLVIDYTGEYADNYIQDEAHYVNTAAGKVVIRPSCGAFYGHEIVLKNKSGNVIPESNYTIRGLDIASTKVCEHTSGVWRYIILETTSYSGPIYVSYHAFGGEVNVNNFLTLQNEFIELRNYINSSSFLTPSSLGGTIVMQEVFARLKTLDHYFRALNLSGYRDMSNRYVATRLTATGSESNWYRVAYLYKQASSAGIKETIQLLNSNINTYIGRVFPKCATPTGSFVDSVIELGDVGKYIIVSSAYLDLNDNNYFTTFTKDSARLKLRLEKSGIFFDFYVYANVVTGELKIHAVEADTENGYCSPKSYKTLKSISLPEFRLVWRKDGNYNYGAALQVKIQIPSGETNEIVSVENHNKAGMGGWILKADNVGVDNVAPENDSVMLPDNMHTWIASGDSTIYGSTRIYPTFKNGTLIWAGCIDMNTLDVENENIPNLNSCFNGNLTFDSIENVAITIFDRYDHVYRTFTSKINAINESGCSAEFEFDPLDLSYFKLLFSKSNGSLIITPKAILGTKSMYLHKFDLRQIAINKEM